MEFINQMEPVFDEKEENAVKEYISRRAWLTEYKETRRFEDMIAEYTGAKYCSVVANGTVSLMIALLACGIRRGDEVICPGVPGRAVSEAAGRDRGVLQG